MTQATRLPTLIQGALLGNTHRKNLRSAKRWIPQEPQTSFKNKDISLPTNYHPFPAEELVPGLNFLRAPPVSTHHPTQPWPGQPHLSRRIQLLMRVTSNAHGGLPRPKANLYFIGVTYFMVFVPPTLLSCYKHWAYQATWLGIQTLDILNHVPAFSRQEDCVYQTTCPHSTNQL